jgi:predicted metalloprotease with PDZ domain
MEFPMRTIAFRLVAFLLLSLPVAAFGGERGFFGFAPNVTTGGFVLNPTVQGIVIARVVPGSPAARAGILAGDEVLKVEDTVVRGAKALALHGMIEKDVGQTLRATLRHAGGAVYSVSMVAVARP